MGKKHVHCIVSGHSERPWQQWGIRDLLWCEMAYEDHVIPQAVVSSVNSSHSEQYLDCVFNAAAEKSFYIPFLLESGTGKAGSNGR